MRLSSMAVSRVSRVSRVSVVAVAAVLSLSSCGGDDDAAESGTDATSSGETGGTTGTTADGGGETDPTCEGPPFTFDLRAADVYGELEPFEEPEFEVKDTVAVRVSDAAYTMYLADYEIDRSIIGTYETPHPPDGKTLITLSITVFNAEEEPPPIEVGDVIPTGAEFGEQTFIVIVERGADMYNSSQAPSGEVEVLGLDADTICVSVDYQDLEEDETMNGEQVESPVQKRLVGTASAEVLEMGF